MNIAKTKKNIDNLEKIKDIIKISKFDTLQKLQSTSRITSTFYRMALISKDLVQYAENNYSVTSILNKKSANPRTVWVFATIHSALTSASYTKQKKEILDGFNKEKDSIIAIGKDGIQFVRDNKLNILFELKEMDEAIEKLPSMIASLKFTSEMDELKFVSSMTHNDAGPVSILPLDDFDIKLEEKTSIGKKFKFYPSLEASLEYLSEIYIKRVVEALLRDVKFHTLKEKLIRFEQSIKSVDKKIAERISEMRKLSRKIETEELILVAQIAKRGDNNE